MGRVVIIHITLFILLLVLQEGFERIMINLDRNLPRFPVWIPVNICCAAENIHRRNRFAFGNSPKVMEHGLVPWRVKQIIEVGIEKTLSFRV